MHTSSEKGPTLKGKKLLPLGASSFLLEQTPFQKGVEIILTSFDSLSVPTESLIIVALRKLSKIFFKDNTSITCKIRYFLL